MQSELQYHISDMVISLIPKIIDPRMTSFVGNYLRVFLGEEIWYDGWMNIDIIDALSKEILSRDFNVQHESIQVL